MRDPLDLLDLPDWPGATPPRNRPDSPPPPDAVDITDLRFVLYRINDSMVPLYTVGEVAKALGRSSNTIRAWEDKGWIPRAPYRTPTPKNAQLPGKPSKGRRLYSRDQVVFLVNAVHSYNLEFKASVDWPKFRAHVKANWPK